DSAGLVDGTNLYAYVRTNPVMRSDPQGKKSIDDDEEVDKDERFQKQIDITATAVSSKDRILRQLGDLFKERVRAAAEQFGLRPGFLAANLFAEAGRGTLTDYRRAYLRDTLKTSALGPGAKRGVLSSVIGLDDVSELKGFKKFMQPKTSESRFFDEE